MLHFHIYRMDELLDVYWKTCSIHSTINYKALNNLMSRMVWNMLSLDGSFAGVLGKVYMWIEMPKRKRELRLRNSRGKIVSTSYVWRCVSCWKNKKSEHLSGQPSKVDKSVLKLQYEKIHLLILLSLSNEVLYEVFEEQSAFGLWLKLEKLLTKSICNKCFKNNVYLAFKWENVFH